MATVYLARDLKHGRRVAIKLLHPALVATLASDRFLREIEIVASLNHPHILPLLDSGTLPHARGMPGLYYVMPFVEGESLRQRLIREKQLQLDEALTIAREVADALAYAHDQGIVHRDIKPENILISQGHAVVADFGIARALGAAGGETLTGAEAALGTPAYMSPEQRSAAPDPDPRSDIYALGIVLYEMLAGSPPSQSIRARHAIDPVPWPRTVPTPVPAGVEAAIMKALARAPADRFATARQFAYALSPGPPGREGPGGAARSRRWNRPAAVAVLAAVAAVWFLTSRQSRARVIPSATRIAVLPFASSVPDTGLLRLGRDLAVTLTATLDGTGVQTGRRHE